MRLLSTGSLGFIGSNFVNSFKNELSKDLVIVNIDAMYYAASLENIDADIRKSPHYHFVKGNLCDIDLVSSVLDEYEIDTVIHFAAQSHVDNSFNNSLQYTMDNVLGTHTLLEACRRYGQIRRILIISTDEVYGTSGLDVVSEDGDICEEKKTEHSILCPSNPYASSKAAAEMYCMSYLTSFSMPIIITRGNNVFGPHQHVEKLIPRFISLLREGREVTIQGDGSCIRSFLHVFDTVSALRLVLEKGQVGEIYNIGGDSQHEFTVMQVAQKLIKLIKRTDNYAPYITYVPDRPFNDKRYWISNDKLKALGWEPKIDLDTGLRMLLE